MQILESKIILVQVISKHFALQMENLTAAGAYIAL